MQNQTQVRKLILRTSHFRVKVEILESLVDNGMNISEIKIKII